MSWKNKALPLILRSAFFCVVLSPILNMVRYLFNYSSSQVQLLGSLGNYSLLLAILLGLLLVTVIEKPNIALTIFVLICDALVLFALYTNFLTEDHFTIIFFCGFMPVFLLIIVLSYPKTARYMMDKYHEAVRPTVSQKTFQQKSNLPY